MRVTAEEMFTMRPPSRISGSARWMMNSGARTLTAKTRSNSSGVICSRDVISRMPALLTRMSSCLPSRPRRQPFEQRVEADAGTELGAERGGVAVRLLDRGNCLFRGVPVPAVMDGHDRTVSRQALRYGPADPPRGPGHQRRLPVQTRHLSPARLV